MARNLNYQKNLTWQANADKPTTTAGQDLGLIGSFWCPGGYSSTTTTSTRESCDVWGALYSWETAMSFDGRGSWSENTTYNTGAANAANSKFNHGRTASGSGTGGRGICPPNWHVPTDNEWGIILDGMEDGGTSTIHQTTNSTGYIGTYAGKYGKSTCTTASSSGAGVDDTHAYWYYNAETTTGTDQYGFRVLPSGGRDYSGSAFYNRGNRAFFWSSSAYDGTVAWSRAFHYSMATVYRNYDVRSYGLSVRCIRD
jgi:uncharacterized protein (TIGR02145 family)